MSDSVHFKLTWNGETRRFALPRTNIIFFFARQKVAELIGTHNERLTLGWKDTTSTAARPPLLLLNTGNELHLAIDYIARANSLNEATRNAPICIHLEVLEIGKPELWYATKEESREKPEYLYQEDQDDDAASDCSFEYKPSEYAWGEESDVDSTGERFDDDAVSECSTNYKPSEYAWGEESDSDMSDFVMEKNFDTHSDCLTAYEPSVTGSEISDLEKDSDYNDALSVCSTEYKPSEYAWGQETDLMSNRIDDDALSECSTAIEPSEEEDREREMNDVEDTLDNEDSAAAAADTNKVANVHCSHCEYRLSGQYYIQCPSNAAHQYCFDCTKALIMAQAEEQQYCPSGMRCSSGNSDLPWVFHTAALHRVLGDDYNEYLLRIKDRALFSEDQGDQQTEADGGAKTMEKDDDAVSDCSTAYEPSEYAWGEESDQKNMEKDADAVSDCSTAYEPSEYAWGEESDEKKMEERLDGDALTTEDISSECAWGKEEESKETKEERVEEDALSDCSTESKPSEYAWEEDVESMDRDIMREKFDDDALSLCSTQYEPSEYAWGDDVEASDLELKRDVAVSNCLTAYEPSEYAWGEESELEKMEDKFEEDILSECSTEYKPSEYAWGDDLDASDLELKDDGVEDDAVSVGSIEYKESEYAWGDDVDSMDRDIMGETIDDDALSLCSTQYESEYAWGHDNDLEKNEEKFEHDALSLCSTQYEPSEYAWGDDLEASELELMRDTIDDDAVSVGSIDFKPSEYAWGEKIESDMDDLERMMKKLAEAISDCSTAYEPSEYAWGNDCDDDALSECSTQCESEYAWREEDGQDDFDLKEAFMKTAANIMTAADAVADAVENWLQTDAKVALKGAADLLFHSAADKKEKKCKECPKLEKRIDQLEEKINLQSEAVEKLVNRFEKMENRC